MICKYNIENNKVYKFVMPMIKSNMYILLDGNQALIIDPNENETALRLLEEHEVRSIIIILTHEHFDHISGVNYFRAKWPCKVIGNMVCKEYAENPAKNLAAYFMAMFITHSEEERKRIQELAVLDYHCKVDEGFEGEMQLEFATLQICLRETPGHSPGSICICVNNKYIFTGDSLVQGEKIITRLPGGDRKLYREVTRPFLQNLCKDMIVFPGHGEESLLRNLEIA